MLSYDPCSVISLLLLLMYVGSSMTASYPSLRALGRRLAGVALLAAAGWLWSQHEPVQPADWLQLAVEALVVAGFAMSLSWIVFTVFVIVWSATLGALWSATQRAIDDERWRRTQEEETRRVAEARRALESQPVEERPLEPPAPTKEELTTAARERYEAMLKMLDKAGLDEGELASAKATAKQKYLHELNEVMQ